MTEEEFEPIPIIWDDEKRSRVSYKTLKKMGMEHPEPEITKQLSDAIDDSIREVNDEDKASWDARKREYEGDHLLHDTADMDMPPPGFADAWRLPEQTVNMLTSRGHASHPGRRWFRAGRSYSGQTVIQQKLVDELLTFHPNIKVIRIDPKGDSSNGR